MHIPGFLETHRFKFPCYFLEQDKSLQGHQKTTQQKLLNPKVQEKMSQNKFQNMLSNKYETMIFPIASMYGIFTYIYHNNQPFM